MSDKSKGINDHYWGGSKKAESALNEVRSRRIGKTIDNIWRKSLSSEYGTKEGSEKAAKKAGEDAREEIREEEKAKNAKKGK